MPRAFLITHRRYNTVVEYEPRESSPERSVSVGEASEQPLAPAEGGATAALPAPASAPAPASDPASACDPAPATAPLPLNVPVITATDAGPKALPVLPCAVDAEAFYNLTQLAEVSVAAAAGALGPLLAHGCADCGKRYSTASNLARHRQTHRSPADKKARRCPHCDKLYVSMPAFSMHVRTHSQGCKCPYCGKGFSRPWLLQGHIRTHTGEKPFKCTICNKAFADKSNLRAHVQTHSSTKPHVCARCGKAFALKSYLYKHEESSCVRSHGRPGAAPGSDPGSPSEMAFPPPPQPPPLASAHATPPPLSFAITA